MRLIIERVLFTLLLTVVLPGQVTTQERAVTTERRVMESGTTEFSLSQIRQIAVPVNDLERATAFYRDKLGMKYLFTANGMAFFDMSGIRLMLARLNKTASDSPGSVIY